MTRWLDNFFIFGHLRKFPKKLILPNWVLNFANCKITHKKLPKVFYHFGQSGEFSANLVTLAPTFLSELFQLILSQTKFFRCQCQRCLDPSEFGSNLSALRCTVCSVGFVLPERPTDPLTDYVCKNCGNVVESNRVNKIEYINRVKWSK